MAYKRTCGLLCIACRKLGMDGNGKYSIFIKGWGTYPMCYRHMQCIMKIGRPDELETYTLEDPQQLGFASC